MNLKTSIDDVRMKKGSYVVEAALILPVLIVSVCALILIVRIIAVCEMTVFLTSDKMIDSSLEIEKIFNGVSLCRELENELDEYCDFKITRFSFCNQKEGIDDLLTIEAVADFKVYNPLGINGSIRFKEKIRGRAFSGNRQEGKRLDESEFMNAQASEVVYVFPAYGIRFHANNCMYVKNHIKDRSNVLEMEKEDASGKGYTQCKICIGAAYG